MAHGIATCFKGGKDNGERSGCTCRIARLSLLWSAGKEVDRYNHKGLLLSQFLSIGSGVFQPAWLLSVGP